jgi:hypothetical protein
VVVVELVVVAVVVVAVVELLVELVEIRRNQSKPRSAQLRLLKTATISAMPLLQKT